MTNQSKLKPSAPAACAYTRSKIHKARFYNYETSKIIPIHVAISVNNTNTICHFLRLDLPFNNIMSGLEKALFNLKVRHFTYLALNIAHHPSITRACALIYPQTNPTCIQFTAKQINRQANKAGQAEKTEKDKLKKVDPTSLLHLPLHKQQPINITLQAILQGHPDIAKINAENAIRKQNEKLNLLRLASRIDAVASRVQTAVTMRQVTGSMTNVVRGMDQAMKAMDLEKVRC